MIINNCKIHHYYIKRSFYIQTMKYPIIILLILLVNTSAHSQNTIGLPQIINYGYETYKGGFQSWDIKQDEQGRMYFANNEGLLVYDANYWKLYPQPNKTILRSIALDRNRIYAGGQDELGYFLPNAHGNLEYHSLKPLIPKEFASFTDVWEIEVVGESVFFRTWERIFEYKNQAIRVYPSRGGWHHMKKAGNRLLAQDKRFGLFQFQQNQWVPLHPGLQAPGFEISGMVALGGDSILISSLQDGLFLYTNGTLKRKSTAADASFIKSHIYCFEQINRSEFVIGTTSEGTIIINGAGEIVQRIAVPEGLQNNNVLSVFLDKKGNIWTGLNNGISFIAYNSAIKFIKPGKPDELSGYSARVFNGQLYIATSDGAYRAPLSMKAKDLSFSKSDLSKIRNSVGQAWRLDEVNGQLLMGHHNGSYVINNDQANQLTRESGSWMFLPISSIYPSPEVIVGTYAGITKLRFDGKRFIDKGEMKGTYESFRFLALDNDNTLWASHPYRGIFRIQIQPGNDSFYTYELFTEKHGLPSTLRNHVFRVKNRVVFATERGIYEFDQQKKRFYPSPLLKDVFGDAMVQYLTEDQQGNIWFCTGKQIGVVNYSANKPVTTYFPELTGKILSGFENVYPYDQDNVFIASTTGIIHLNYKKYITANHQPSVLLSQMKITGQVDSLVFDGYQGNQQPAQLHFPSKFNSFRFGFSSPAYGGQENVTYSYQLVGYDRGWSAPTTKTEKEYTNIPQGRYTFLVKAYDNLGKASEISSYTFIVDPVWYKTIWAYLFYFFAGLLLIYLGYKFQKKKFEQQQARFEAEQQRLKYIHQLEVEKNEKEIIQLQNEKLVNEMIYKNKELADVSMHLVERTDALVKVKDELQRLHRKTGGNHDVKKAIELVNEIEKNDSNWEQFAAHFDEINDDFIKKLKKRFPKLTSTDLKVCTYLQLKLATKEIAQLMNISVRGVEISRYRLRKKLNLEQGQTLNDFLNEIHGE